MHLALLGDSVFDNEAYVPAGYDVRSQLSERLPADWAITVAAEDGATTKAVVRQMAFLPSSVTHLFVSVGGNDALEQIDLLATPVSTSGQAFDLLWQAVDAFSLSYQKAIDRCLQHGVPTTVCTIYEGGFEHSSTQRAVRMALTAFNDVIIRSAVEREISILDLRLVCRKHSDFVKIIEPSRTGGAKIAKALARIAMQHTAQCRSRVFA